eukprot:gene2861-4704_t
MQRAAIYPKVVLSGFFFGGMIYGNQKQQSLYSKALDIVTKEDKEIESYRTEVRQREELERATLAGEDLSLYNVPAGLRGLVSTFRNTNKKKEESK